MLNQVILVGRLVRNPELRTTETNKLVSTITLAIPRSFKNMNGEYDTDFVDCVVWDKSAKATEEYTKQGDIVGVKGRLQSRSYEKDGIKRYVTEVVAEKVTFLSTNREEDKKKNN